MRTNFGDKASTAPGPQVWNCLRRTSDIRLIIQQFQTVVEGVFIWSVGLKRSVKFPLYWTLETLSLTYLLSYDFWFRVVIAAMAQYFPPFPSIRGPSVEFSIAYLQSGHAIFKIVEVVRIAELRCISFAKITPLSANGRRIPVESGNAKIT